MTPKVHKTETSMVTLNACDQMEKLMRLSVPRPSFRKMAVDGEKQYHEKKKNLKEKNGEKQAKPRKIKHRRRKTALGKADLGFSDITHILETNMKKKIESDPKLLDLTKSKIHSHKFDSFFAKLDKSGEERLQ